MSKPNLNSMRNSAKRSALTLIEVLLVVFILSTMAFSAMSLTDGLDQQFRFDETTRRRDRIRAAIVIDSSAQVDGRSVVNGFASDLGRLPNDLQELAEQGAMPDWQYDATVDQWAGWRGPYVNSTTESASGTKAFRDGWGNVDLTPDDDSLFFGWNFTVDQAAGTLAVQSFGQDGLADGSPGAGAEIYDNDFPDISDLLVSDSDHRVNLKGWSVWVEFVNVDGDNVRLPARMRLQLYYPRENGSGGFDWPVATIPRSNRQRDRAEYLSLDIVLPPSQRVLTPGASQKVRFDFTNASTNVEKLIPTGRRSLVVLREPNGTVHNPNSINRPNPITLIPRTGLPTSTSSSPLFVWNVVD